MWEMMKKRRRLDDASSLWFMSILHSIFCCYSDPWVHADVPKVGHTDSDVCACVCVDLDHTGECVCVCVCVLMNVCVFVHCHACSCVLMHVCMCVARQGPTNEALRLLL